MATVALQTIDCLPVSTEIAENMHKETLMNNNNNNNNNDTDSDKNIELMMRESMMAKLEDSNPEIKAKSLQEFYNGSHVLITGGTGFMGKILMEKLLRSCPGVEQIYLLIRPKKGKDVYSRIDEIFDDPVFELVKKEVPKFRHKVSVVSGDVAMPGLGLNVTDRQILIEKVDIVIHGAATVRFDEKLSLALSINVSGVKSMVELAKCMKKLKSFVHVSTAYSHCNRLDKVSERFYKCPLKYSEVDQMVSRLSDSDLEEVTPIILGTWPNTYSFTKALAEDYIRENCKGLPIGMFRPAIVTSTYKEPIIGWVDNLYGPTGVIAGAATGVLRTLHCNGDMNANVVPVDMCVNALIASAWDIANNSKERKEDNMLIYNYVSSADNPLNWHQLTQFCIKYGFEYPFGSAVWYYSFTLNKSIFWHKIYMIVYQFCPAVLIDGLALCAGQKPRLLKLYKKIHKFSEVISYFCTHEWTFTNDNVKLLWKKLDKNDKEDFPFDVAEIDWRSYFKSYLRGMRIYLFKEKYTEEEAKIRWKRFYIFHMMLKSVVGISLSFAAWSLFHRLLSKFY